MKKFEVEFCGDNGKNSLAPINAMEVDYMLVNAVDSDGEEVKLYAECAVVDSPFENVENFEPDEFSKYSYPILKAEIIAQAIIKGVNPDLIDFSFYDSYETTDTKTTKEEKEKFN